MEHRPILLIATFNKPVNDYLCESISSVIGHLVDVRGYIFEERSFIEYRPDLVLSSGDYCDPLVREAFPDIPMISATRVLTGNNLEQVLAIPPETRVLVISYPKGPVQESIDLLKQAGINHILYDCYERGMPVEPGQYEYAITANMAYVCPVPIKHVINLGQKALSVRSFMEILEFFGLDMRYANVFENRYFRLHIETCRKVVSALGDSEHLRQTQSFTLDEMDEGIVSLDESGQLLFANQSAQRFFPSGGDILANPELQQAIAQLDRERIAARPDTPGRVSRTADIIISAQGGSMLCRKSIVDIDAGGQRQRLYTFRRTEQIQALEQSVRRKLYNKGFSARYNFGDIWGDNPRSMRVRAKALAFAGTEQTVLIVGESGTGKEMLAQAIHNSSSRAGKPFVGVNLTSMSQSLIESELFGYQEGAFTGARRGGKPGLFEIANEGTLFLDEIGDAPLGVQILLLRVLEERVITRVGGLHPIPINVRIIAATNQPLHDMIKTGAFRSDLYYRLNVLSIRTAPLRTMRDEVAGFLSHYCHQLFGYPVTFSGEAVRILTDYNWPGNFRELKNVAEYLHCICGGQAYLTVDDLPEYLLAEMQRDMRADRQEMETLAQRLRAEPVLTQALRLFAASPGGLGRTALAAALGAENGAPLTESRVRHIVTILRREELLRAGSTRQGSFLTERGSAYLRWLDEKA